jgi:hypothetical protein
MGACDGGLWRGRAATRGPARAHASRTIKPHNQARLITQLTTEFVAGKVGRCACCSRPLRLLQSAVALVAIGRCACCSRPLRLLREGSSDRLACSTGHPSHRGVMDRVTRGAQGGAGQDTVGPAITKEVRPLSPILVS